MGKQSKKSAYKGELAQPLSSELGDDELSIAIRRRVDQLFNHYRIDPSGITAWVRLASSLAHQHVPGFQARKRTGAPRKWTDTNRALLAIDVAELQRKNPQLSSAEACRHLSRHQPWKGEASKGSTEAWQKRLEDEVVKGRKMSLYEKYMAGERWPAEWHRPFLFPPNQRERSLAELLEQLPRASGNKLPPASDK
jgi:hypothetical protein